MARKRFRMKKKKRRKKRRRPAVDDFPMNPGWRTGGEDVPGPINCTRRSPLHFLFLPLFSSFLHPTRLRLFLDFWVEEEIFGKRNSRRRKEERKVSSDKFHLLAIILLGVGG